MLDDKPAPKQHLVYVDSKKEAAEFDPVKYFNTLPEFIERAYNRPTLEQLASPDLIVGSRGSMPTRKELKHIEHKRTLNYAELKARKERAKKLGQGIEETQTIRNLMGKGRRKKVVVGDGKAVYKWKRERKK